MGESVHFGVDLLYSTFLVGRESGGSHGKASAYNAGDPGSIPGLGRPSGGGNGNPLQYSYLKNPMNGGAWWATVHGAAKSRTRLSDLTCTFILCIREVRISCCV